MAGIGGHRRVDLDARAPALAPQLDPPRAVDLGRSGSPSTDRERHRIVVAVLQAAGQPLVRRRSRAPARSVGGAAGRLRADALRRLRGAQPGDPSGGGGLGRLERPQRRVRRAAGGRSGRCQRARAAGLERERHRLRRGPQPRPVARSTARGAAGGRRATRRRCPSSSTVTSTASPGIERRRRVVAVAVAEVEHRRG